LAIKEDDLACCPSKTAAPAAKLATTLIEIIR
jgi:hypothetical protein